VGDKDAVAEMLEDPEIVTVMKEETVTEFVKEGDCEEEGEAVELPVSVEDSVKETLSESIWGEEVVLGVTRQGEEVGVLDVRGEREDVGDELEDEENEGEAEPLEAKEGEAETEKVILFEDEVIPDGLTLWEIRIERDTTMERDPGPREKVEDTEGDGEVLWVTVRKMLLLWFVEGESVPDDDNVSAFTEGDKETDADGHWE
jgi:hypothetical protein